jgi:hypothetical protein
LQLLIIFQIVTSDEQSSTRRSAGPKDQTSIPAHADEQESLDRLSCCTDRVGNGCLAWLSRLGNGRDIAVNSGFRKNDMDGHFLTLHHCAARKQAGREDGTTSARPPAQMDRPATVGRIAADL